MRLSITIVYIKTYGKRAKSEDPFEIDEEPTDDLRKEMMLDILKQHKKYQKINGRFQANEEERILFQLEWKLFQPLNPIPLQVLALRSAGHLFRMQKADIGEIIPKNVLEMAMMRASTHARDNPSYPVRGVYFHVETCYLLRI